MKKILVSLVAVFLMGQLAVAHNHEQTPGPKSSKAATAQECKQCWGSGKTTCFQCNGKGTVRKSGIDRRGKQVFTNERCDICRGSGKVTCRACRGTGKR